MLHRRTGHNQLPIVQLALVDHPFWKQVLVQKVTKDKHIGFHQPAATNRQEEVVVQHQLVQALASTV
jgi:hypothetical protein